jgi:sigma-E factor negative regulatory protein RseC
MIEHKGRVIFIDGNRIDVEMVVESACGSCKARKACGVGDTQNKIVSLWSESATYYSEGEEVMVGIEQKKGMKAATYAYIFPFFIMLAVLLVMFEAGFREAVAGLSALGSLVVYYLVLFLLKGRIEKEFVFKISKI